MTKVLSPNAALLTDLPVNILKSNAAFINLLYYLKRVGVFVSCVSAFVHCSLLHTQLYVLTQAPSSI